MTSHNLATWSIFNEQSGEITVKIKFKNQGEGQSAISNACYRRKSQNQVDRDRARAVKRKRHSSTHNGQPEESPETERLDQSTMTEDNLNISTLSIADQPSVLENDTPVRHTPCIPEVNELYSVPEEQCLVNSLNMDNCQDVSLPNDTDDADSTQSKSEPCTCTDKSETEVDDDQDTLYISFLDTQISSGIRPGTS